MEGILVVNKPAGYTSHDIVSKIRKQLNIKKVGHTGTLDPLATGVLPILLGNGTKLSQYLMNHDKEYIATIKLGEKTESGDLEGKVIEQKAVPNFSKEQVQEVLANFKGKQNQIPPMYSAIKVNGKKLYEYARNGEMVVIEPREIEIYNIELVECDSKEISFKVQCSKGTYIRSLCENIAEKLGTVGTMSALKRTQVGEFRIENAISIDDIENEEVVRQHIITPEKLFLDKGIMKLTQRELVHFLNGVKLSKNCEDGLYRIYVDNKFIGIGKVKGNVLKREYV